YQLKGLPLTKLVERQQSGVSQSEPGGHKLRPEIRSYHHPEPVNPVQNPSHELEGRGVGPVCVLEYHQHWPPLRQEDQLLLENVHGSLLANQLTHDRFELRGSLRIGNRQTRRKQWSRLCNHIRRACKHSLELVQLGVGRVMPLPYSGTLEVTNERVHCSGC